MSSYDFVIRFVNFRDKFVLNNKNSGCIKANHFLLFFHYAFSTPEGEGRGGGGGEAGLPLGIAPEL